MDTLPLHPLHSLLPLDEPFTPAMAGVVGVDRSAMDRMVREGLVRRVLRGVYAASDAPDSVGLRAAAAVSRSHGGRSPWTGSAAWVHGVSSPEPRTGAARRPRAPGGRPRVTGRESTLVGRDVMPIARSG